MQGAADYSALWLFDSFTNDLPNGSAYYLYMQNNNTPSIIGWTPGMNGLSSNSLFNNMTTVLKALCIQKEQPTDSLSTNLSQNFSFDHAYLADAREKRTLGSAACSQKKQNQCTLRLTPFNNFVVQKAQSSIPAFTNEITGAVATFDIKKEQIMLGAGGAYIYNHTHASQMGSLNINQEMLVAYSSWQNETFFVDAAFWGGFFQFQGVRKTQDTLTGHFRTHGYTVSPHVEFRAKFPFAWNMEALAMMDWINQRQCHYTEHGSLNFRLNVPKTHGSLLRSEAGLRFWQLYRLGWGNLEITEKASYVNQLPFQKSVTSVLLIGASPFFSVGAGSLSTQNLGAAEFRFSFFPHHPKMPFGILDLQGEFGSKLQSYFVATQIGKHF